MTSISVVIPTYDRRLELERAVDSVLAQSRRADEIIVVDDGSTDGTVEWLESRADLILVALERRAGVSAARNAGIRRSTGQWIAFLDSDDEWHPEKLAEQVLALTQEPRSVICHTNELWFRAGKRVNQGLRHRKTGGWIFERCVPLCAISPSSVMMRRTLFDEIGFFAEDLPACEDYDMWLRVCSKHPVTYVETPLTIKHGGRPDQLSVRIKALDKYRIVALDRILGCSSLTSVQQLLVIDTMLQKISVYAAGARKRGRHDEAAELEALAADRRELRKRIESNERLEVTAC